MKQTATKPSGLEKPLAKVSLSEDEQNLFKSDLSVAEKVKIAMSVGEEVQTIEELEKLYTARDHPIVYDGFEPSGRMHIAQGVLRLLLSYIIYAFKNNASLL